MTLPLFTKDIQPISIEEEMKRSYLDYAMSVIVSRALPDVRDGLKPVHRRILFAMSEAGNDYNKPYKKAARAVGDVMSKYHPHGDTAIYDTLVRMAQWFSMGAVLIDGQGNFGSMDGDKAAAMRYTEVRLSRIAHFLLEDIDKDTVEFQPNYDESLKEPLVLPARFPNVLVNGVGGIAVGMATNIPTHNLGEVIDACSALIDDPEISIDDMMAFIPGPDFPTGGSIIGRKGARDAFHTGRGSVIIRSKSHVESLRKDKQAIVVTEIPYQINKAKLIERIAELVNNKAIEGISDLRDESNREGVRVVIELKRDVAPDVILNQLYKHTALQTSFGVNMLALHRGKPELLNLKQMLQAFIEFREEVIIRRTRFDLNKARQKAHLLVGLAVAVANIDEVIALIRRAPNPEVAKEQLMAKDWPVESILPLVTLVDDPAHCLRDTNTYHLTETQAKAILDLRLHRLTGLERDKLTSDIEEIATLMHHLIKILTSRTLRLMEIKRELQEIKSLFPSPRRTIFEDGEALQDAEDLIQREDMVVTVSHGGYIKRVPLSTYRSQRRGGKGRTGMSTREEDFVQRVFVASTHAPVLFFSTKGLVYAMKVYRLPEGSAQSRGKAMINIFSVDKNETMSTVLPLPESPEESARKFMFFVTSKGNVRRNKVEDFSQIRANGKIAIKLDDDEHLVGVTLCEEGDDVFITTRKGRAIRFGINEIRVFAGRSSNGVRGIKLGKNDKVVSACILKGSDATPSERYAFLRQATQERRLNGLEDDTADIFAIHDSQEDDTLAAGPVGTTLMDEPLLDEAPALSPERYAALQKAEEFILAVTANGFAKRTSSYAYRVTRRGGVGVINMALNPKTGDLIDSFPVHNDDEIMLVTNGGQLMRCPVEGIRICGRSSQGVITFRVADNEQVVSVARLDAQDAADAENLEDLPS